MDTFYGTYIDLNIDISQEVYNYVYTVVVLVSP